MNDIIKYQWSVELAKAALKAYNKAKVGRFSALLCCGVILIVIGFTGYILTDKPMTLPAGVIGILFVGILLKQHFGIVGLSEDAARFIQDPTVTVTISDDALTIASDQSTRTVKWNKLTHFKQSDNFLLLFAGKLLFVSLPCQSFNDEQIAVIKEKFKI